VGPSRKPNQNPRLLNGKQESSQSQELTAKSQQRISYLPNGSSNPNPNSRGFSPITAADTI
jgi:hypothetical protein